MNIFLHALFPVLIFFSYVCTIQASTPLSECLRVEPRNRAGTRAIIGLKPRTLDQLYAGSGHCRNVVTTHSVRVNGICSPYIVHTPNRSWRKACLKRYGVGWQPYRQCLYHSIVIKQSQYVRTRGAVSGKWVQVIIYAKNNCRNKIRRGYIKVDWAATTI